MQRPAASSEQPARALRADARRNRELVLRAAITAFATEGTSVSVAEIARRAGVGTGTVSRHFPTKEALFGAIVHERAEQLVRRARELHERLAPIDAFFEFFTVLVAEGSTDRGLAEALANAGFDVEAAASAAAYDFGTALADLLDGAQTAGGVRPEITVADIKALLEGCLARERFGVDSEARGRLIGIIRRGLRPDPRMPRPARPK
ncbi:helix-turn-helix domain-containing protein [Micromonospora sp. NPDC005215]|uniref:TetR/AcrR family transcriptional regulator n=1 Tax=Micromonospora sp. NPDC005215 TaxID=3157024 RepID=UPI0033A2CAB0